MEMEIKFKDSRTITYGGIDFKITPEFLQDFKLHNNAAEDLKKYIHQMYLRQIDVVRQIKINQILSND